MGNKTLQFHLLNAFVVESNRYSGNQAAVVLFEDQSDERSKDDNWLTLTARDFNYSETAYLVPLSASDDGKQGEWGLRWFTPEVEINLCGHATLASSEVLFSLNPLLETAKYHTKSGILTAKRDGNDKVEISLPGLSKEVLSNLVKEDIDQSETKGLARAFDIDNVESSILGYSEIDFSGIKCLVVQLNDNVKVDDIKVDIKALVEITGSAVVTQVDKAKSIETKQLHINSRVFGPAFGIEEDPVTGSSHAHLTGYYLNSAGTKHIPRELLEQVGSPKELVVIGHQRSKRGGELICRWNDDGNIRITGKAFEFGRGTLN
ncbi:uncharacterized protein L201_000918 [Kwoniella dendrophila CBS 6074]|uniref:Phenazine biosynthesis protein n=1 Tax=Kwoniella dendrophila CBS 6074 TaxID=1295534 RepID=A0AAX4JKW1_9TREE